MNQDPWLHSLFANIDAKDTAGFLAHLTPDAVFQYGNLPPVQGADAIGAMVGGFFAGIAGLRHALEAHWTCGDTTICHGRVAYTRHDGSRLEVPFANVMTRRDGPACTYRIYIDISQLFPAAA